MLRGSIIYNVVDTSPTGVGVNEGGVLVGVFGEDGCQVRCPFCPPRCAIDGDEPCFVVRDIPGRSLDNFAILRWITISSEQ